MNKKSNNKDNCIDDFSENFPSYKSEFIRDCLNSESIITEIEETRYGHKYHAAVEDSDGWVWMVTIETDGWEELEEESRIPDVTFRKCFPGHELSVLQSWETIAVKALYGPSDLKSWRILMKIFDEANDLLKSHEYCVLTEYK